MNGSGFLFPRPPPDFSARLLYYQELAKGREGKQTEIKEMSVILAYVVKIWKKEREVKSKFQNIPIYLCVPCLLGTQLLIFVDSWSQLFQLIPENSVLHRATCPPAERGVCSPGVH